MAGKLKEDWTRAEPENLPPAGRLVLVMCWQENHIGYRDKEGHWRHAVHHQELTNVLGWCAISAKGWGR